MRAFSRLISVLGWIFCLLPSLALALPSVLPELTRIGNTTLILSLSSNATSAANTAANYTLGGTGGLSGSPSAAALDTSGTIVTLTVPTMAALIHGDTVTVTVNNSVSNVADPAGNLVATYTVDSVPASFSFTAASNALTATAYESNAVQISGINTTVTVGTTTGSNSSLKCAKLVNGETVWGSFGTCSSVTLASGDQIKLQLTSAATYSTTVSGGIIIGGVSATFSVTTLSAAAAAPVPIPSNVTTSALTSLATAISSPPSSLYLSSNGVVVIPASTSGTITLLATAPAKTAFWIQSGATANFAVQGSNLTIAAASNQNVLAVLRSFKLDNYSSLQTLEISQGRATITSAKELLPAASLRLGTGTTPTQVGILARANSQPAFDIEIGSDGTATLGVKSGSIALRTASSDSTIAVTDTATSLYANEVASLSTAGALTAIRIGSLDGNGSGVGDALTFDSNTIVGTDIDRLVKIPRLSGAVARINETDTLLEALFDAIGLRSNLARGGQTTQGVIPLLIGNTKYYFTPFGNVVVDTTRSDGVVLTRDGIFEITRKGVTARFRPSILDTKSFATSMGVTYGADVSLDASGAVEIAEGGDTLLMVPEMFTQAVSGASSGVAYDENGYLTYTKSNETQRLLPIFYDTTQLATAFASLADTISVQENLDGTATATLATNVAEAGAATPDIVTTTYVLAPDYRVLSPFAVPIEHHADAWWVGNDGLIYIKYANGSAQGFSIR